VIGLAELPRRQEDVYHSNVETKNVDRGSWSSHVGDGSWELGVGGTRSNSQLEEVQQ
jgi:hypothetical protein